MTKPKKTPARTGAEPRPSLLPFDPADLVALRVRPAQFARMVGVSRQCVSQWIKQGKVTLGPDGRLDPAQATREVIERTDPARLRARVFRQAMAGRDELLARLRDAEAALAEAEAVAAAREQAARFQESDEAHRALGALLDALGEQWDAGTTARAAGQLDSWLDALVSRVWFGEELDEDA